MDFETHTQLFCHVASSHSTSQSMLAEMPSQELEILQAESFTACMPLLIAAGTFRLGKDAGVLVVGVGNTVEYVQCTDDHWLRLDIVQQVSQQAYKTQIPLYSLKQRCPQFPVPMPCTDAVITPQPFIPEVMPPPPWLPVSQCSPKGDKTCSGSRPTRMQNFTRQLFPLLRNP